MIIINVIIIIINNKKIIPPHQFFVAVIHHIIIILLVVLGLVYNKINRVYTIILYEVKNLYYSIIIISNYIQYEGIIPNNKIYNN